MSRENVTYYVEKSTGKLLDEYQMKQQLHTKYQCPEDQWSSYYEVVDKIMGAEWDERH